MLQTPALLITILIGAISQASVQRYVPVFRATESPFPSGELALTDLTKTKVNQQVEQWQYVQWKNQKFWLPSEYFLQPLQTSRYVTLSGHTLLLKSPYGFSNVIRKLDAGTQALAIAFRNDWVKILLTGKGNEPSLLGWVPSFFLNELDADRGYLYSRYNTHVYQYPTGTAKALGRVRLGTRLEPLEWGEEWVKVQVGPSTGYIPLNHLVGRAHFAKEVLYKEKWRQIEKVAFPHIKLAGLSSAAVVKDIKGYRGAATTEGMVLTQDLIGYAKPTLQGPKIALAAEVLAQRATLLRYEHKTWHMSMTPGHGPVWWSPNLSTAPQAVTTKPTQEILKRNIFSVATHPTSEHQTLLSADGIYYTRDGESWDKLESFGEKNLPVAIGKDGSLFVGDQWSKDAGKNFSAYIRWDGLTKEITARMKKAPDALRIEKLELGANSGRVKIKINTGSKVFTALGSPESGQWKLLP